MATFMNKALAYLGLKDLEDDELYDEDYDDVEPVAPQRHGAHTVYPDQSADDHPDARGYGGVVRPIVGEDPGQRQAVVRPLVQPRAVGQKVHIVAPERFAEAQEIGDLVKQANPVIVNLQLSESDLARRMIDFCSGLTYALGGSMEKVADQVFLLTPSNVEVSAEERLRLQERGLFRS